MNKGTQHRMLVDGMLNMPEAVRKQGMHAIMRHLAKIAPHANGDDIGRALADVRGIIEERKTVTEAENDALRKRYLPLFEGMPAGTSLAEAAEHKARCGDPLGMSACEELGIVI